jgi:hypothetical protein
MRLLAAAPLLALVAGCSATVDDGADGEPDVNLQGAVHVESVVGKSGQLRTQVSARFLRVFGIDSRTAEEVVGSEALTTQLGCSEIGASAVPDVQGSIELIDVGEILVHMADRVMPLAARAFPDVGDLVSGVVYTSRDDQTALADAGTYVIETSGSSLIDGFSVQVDAPDAPSSVHFGTAASFDGESPLLIAGDALALTWDGPDSDDDDADLIYVEILNGEDDVRCVFEDDGAATVPAAYTNYLPGTDVDVVVHRYRQINVKLPGVDEAYVDFDFAVSTPVTWARAATN